MSTDLIELPVIHLDEAPAAPTLLEPIPLQMTRFQCPYCKVTRARRKPCLDHMERCWKNPALRACKTCVFFVPGGYEPKSRVTTGSGGVRPVQRPARCKAGYGIGKGLVTNCRKWKSVEGPQTTAT